MTYDANDFTIDGEKKSKFKHTNKQTNQQDKNSKENKIEMRYLKS
jgi:hypothetical protein